MDYGWPVFLGLAVAAVAAAGMSARREMCRPGQVVRVVLYVRNGEEVLEGIIRTILTWQALGWPLELAAVDLGSGDRSPLILHRLLADWHTGDDRRWEVFPVHLTQDCDARRLLRGVRERVRG